MDLNPSNSWVSLRWKTSKSSHSFTTPIREDILTNMFAALGPARVRRISKHNWKECYGSSPQQPVWFAVGRLQVNWNWNFQADQKVWHQERHTCSQHPSRFCNLFTWFKSLGMHLSLMVDSAGNCLYCDGLSTWRSLNKNPNENKHLRFQGLLLYPKNVVKLSESVSF